MTTLFDPVIRVQLGDRLAWRHWDGELVFYDAFSGETQLLAGIAGTVLEMLIELGPVTPAELEQAIAAAFDTPLDAEFQNLLYNALQSLRGNHFIAYPDDETPSVP